MSFKKVFISLKRDELSFMATCTIIAVCGSGAVVTPNNTIFGEIGQRGGQIGPAA